MITLARLLWRMVAWTLFGLALAVGVFLARLNSGPVAIDWLEPHIAQSLTPGNDTIKVTIGETALRLNKSRRTIELVALDVNYDTEDGQPVLAFPEVLVSLSVKALLDHGIVAASNIEAKAPSLHLTTDQQGLIGVHSPTGHREQPASDFDFAAFFRHFILAPEADNRIAYLKRLKVSGGHLVFNDGLRQAELRAEAAELVMIRQERGVSGWLKGDLLQESGRATLQLLGRVDEATERVDLVLDAANLILPDLLAPWRSTLATLPDEVLQIKAPLQALIKGSIDLKGQLSPLHVDLRTTDYRLELPTHLAEPLDITLAEFKGVILPGFKAVRVDQYRLTALGTDLSASGLMSWQDHDVHVALDLEALNIRAETLSALWPLKLGPTARAWVLENIKAGIVPQGEARLELRGDDLGPGPLREDALKGSFTFEDLRVRYIDTMPPLEQGKGRVTFDADRLHFDVESAANAGVDVVGGTVTITGLGKPGRHETQVKVQVTAEGPIDQALTLLDHPPLDVAKNLEIEPAQTSGEFKADLYVSLPLYNDVKKEEVDLRANADLSRTVIRKLPRLGGDVDLENGTLQLAIDDRQATLSGRAEIAGLPLQINLTEPLAEGERRRRILVKGRLDQDRIKQVGVDLEALDGALGFTATLTETAENLWIDLESDLTDLALAFPGLAWQKRIGDNGRLLASIALPNDGPIEIKHLELMANDLRIMGHLTLLRPDYSIDMLTLSDIRLGSNQGSLRVQRRDKVGKNVVVEVKSLDLDSLLTDEKKKTSPFDLNQLHLAIRADRLVYQGVELLDLKADLAHGKEAWRTASLLATLPSGNRISLELVPDGDHRRLDIRSDDAGTLLETLGLGRRIDRGRLHLSARVSSQTPLSAKGRLVINDFTIADAPLLARLLTVASFEGIGNLLEGEGIQADKLTLPFSLDHRILTLSDGLLRGSQLGLTTKGTLDLRRNMVNLEGTIIPIYTLNRLIGQVPIIGRILTGTDGLGAFAATYQISGPQERPEVFVNPLSILTPGLVRDFFGGLINGTLSPPELRDTDD